MSMYSIKELHKLSKFHALTLSLNFEFEKFNKRKLQWFIIKMQIKLKHRIVPKFNSSLSLHHLTISMKFYVLVIGFLYCTHFWSGHDSIWICPSLYVSISRLSICRITFSLEHFLNETSNYRRNDALYWIS